MTTIDNAETTSWRDDRMHTRTNATDKCTDDMKQCLPHSLMVVEA